MTKRTQKENRISYEPEADVLRVEVAKGKIDYASEVGNVIVHFNKVGIPLYFEILNATKFVRQSTKELSKAGIPEFAV